MYAYILTFIHIHAWRDRERECVCLYMRVREHRTFEGLGEEGLEVLDNGLDHLADRARQHPCGPHIAHSQSRSEHACNKKVQKAHAHKLRTICISGGTVPCSKVSPDIIIQSGHHKSVSSSGSPCTGLCPQICILRAYRLRCGVWGVATPRAHSIHLSIHLFSSWTQTLPRGGLRTVNSSGSGVLAVGVHHTRTHREGVHVGHAGWNT